MTTSKCPGAGRATGASPGEGASCPSCAAWVTTTAEGKAPEHRPVRTRRRYVR